jgi:hypothetical protein
MYDIIISIKEYWKKECQGFCAARPIVTYQCEPRSTYHDSIESVFSSPMMLLQIAVVCSTLLAGSYVGELLYD